MTASNAVPPQPVHSSSVPDPKPVSGEPSLFDLGAVLLEHLWWILLTGVLLATLFAGFIARMSPTYTSVASVMPQGGGSGSTASRLSGLAAQFGVSLGSSGSGPSPELYAYMLKSETVLRVVVNTRLAIFRNGKPDTTTLIKQFGAGRTHDEIEASAIRRLANSLTILPDDAAGLVHITFVTPRIYLSQPVLAAVVDQLNTVNQDLRQAQAASESKFISDQLQKEAGELRKVEDQMQAFLAGNRQYQNDPQLQFEHDRIDRGLQIAQGVYLTLAQGYQQVRIDAARNTPIVSVAEPPLVPNHPDKKPYLIAIIAGVVGGISLGVLWALIREFRKTAGVNRPESYARFTTAVANLKRNAAKPFWWVRRRFARA